LTPFLLLPVSAAAGLVIVKAVRWYHPLGRMPPRSALDQEAAYANFLTRTIFDRVGGREAMGVLLWMSAEGFPSLAVFSYERRVTFLFFFDKNREHVVVKTLVNFAQEGRAFNQLKRSTERVQQSACPFTWRAGDMRVEVDLIVEGCWWLLFLDAEDKSVADALFNNSLVNVTDSTFLLWPLETTPDEPTEQLLLERVFEEPVMLEAYTTAWLLGTPELYTVQWPDKQESQLW
jgi:hypothetical protein